MTTSKTEQQVGNSCAMTGQLPMRKRKKPDNEAATAVDDVGIQESPSNLMKKKPANIKQKEVRLEQNRKAARESRRRKKVMIEELQRSVIFFSRANGTLKQQNDDLARLLMKAQAQVSLIETQAAQTAQASTPQVSVSSEPSSAKPVESEQSNHQGFQQSQAQAVATQAAYEAQGFSPAAARAAAQAINSGSHFSTQPNASVPISSHQQQLPPMQPGATMQAMANFQQAAAAAMQAAIQGMQGIPGVSISSLAAAAPGSDPQQAYNDTMTALAMQQAAAAAAAGQQFFQNNPFVAHQMLAWQQQSAAAAAQAAAQPIQPSPPSASSQPSS